MLDLVSRLRGVYFVPVNDGAGPLNGKDSFTREFHVAPIQREAADRIERLEIACRAVLHSILNTDLEGNILWILPPHQAEAVHESAAERLADVLGLHGDLNRGCLTCGGTGFMAGDVCRICKGAGVD